MANVPHDHCLPLKFTINLSICILACTHITETSIITFNYSIMHFEHRAMLTAVDSFNAWSNANIQTSAPKPQSFCLSIVSLTEWNSLTETNSFPPTVIQFRDGRWNGKIHWHTRWITWQARLSFAQFYRIQFIWNYSALVTLWYTDHVNAIKCHRRWLTGVSTVFESYSVKWPNDMECVSTTVRVINHGDRQNHRQQTFKSSQW